MKSFIKLMCLTLSLILAASVVIACVGDKDENYDPITTAGTTTCVVTTDNENTTTSENTTASDGFGPLIPLVTDKK